MKVAVIGAGIGGLVSLYSIKKRIPDAEVICFERSSDLGGEWRITDEPESFVENISMRSSMYKGLRSNTPLPIAELHPDFPWPEGTATFPYRHEFLEHINNFADHFKLRDLIQYNHVVTNIARYLDTDKIQLSVRNLVDSTEQSLVFDYVFSCNGQHRIPHIPTDADMSKYTGERLHYHDLQDPSKMYGKKVVVVGSLFGAMDLVILLVDHCKIIASWNRAEPYWYNKIVEKRGVVGKPKITHGDGRTVYFADGTSIDDVDAILYGTGFKHSNPLSEELQLDFNDRDKLFPLYKQVVHPKLPSLFFIGKTHALIIFCTRIGAELGCAIANGKFAVPSYNEMTNDMEKFREKWEHTVKSGAPVEYNVAWAKDISNLVGCPAYPEHTTKLVYGLFWLMGQNCFNYRQHCLKKNWEEIENIEEIFE